MARLLLLLAAGLIVLAAYTYQRDAEPDPRLIDLAVRATIYAFPSPAPQQIEVTRIVEVTRLVEVVRLVEVTPAPSATPTPLPTSTAEPTEVTSASEPIVVAAAPGVPALAAAESEAGLVCPAESLLPFDLVPVAGSRLAHPDSQHGDLNLALRGYEETVAELSLISTNGPADADAPQLGAIFADGRAPIVSAAFHIRDWDWECGEHGCRGSPLPSSGATLIALAARPGESLYAPHRQSEIYGGGYVALVLYAEPNRLTLGYTREDSVANGYAVHLEDICVSPGLLALYRYANDSGRSSLPAVHNGESLGVAKGVQILVAIRDRGAFQDPRSRKDWWRDH